MATTIKFPKSDSFAFFVTINKISHLLDNAFFTVKENPNEEPVLQKKLGAGISLVDNRLYKNQLSYKVQIDGADTQFMVVGARYFFDVKGTIGNAQKTFLWGELILSETETGYINPATQGDTVAIAETYTATFETGAQSQYVETESDPVAMAKIGDMMTLNTTAKGTLVKAINEVNAPTFTQAANLENVVSGEKQSMLWGKVKKWFSSLKALAFKDKVGTADINDGAVTGTKIQAGAISDTQIAYAGISSTRIAKKAITTEKFADDAKCPFSTDATNTDFTNSEWVDIDVHNATAGATNLVAGATYEVIPYGTDKKMLGCAIVTINTEVLSNLYTNVVNIDSKFGIASLKPYNPFFHTINIEITKDLTMKVHIVSQDYTLSDGKLVESGEPFESYYAFKYRRIR